MSDKKGKQVLRFGIHDGAGHRAATWNLWTKTGTGKSDVYLLCRELFGTIKASFHESGQWRHALSPITFEEDVKGAIPKLKDRVLEKWHRPPEIKPGRTLALRIVTPWSAARIPFKKDRFKGVKWLLNAPESMATEIDILFTKPIPWVIEWPGKRLMGTSLVGSLPLENGETVWAVYSFVEMPDFSSLSKGTTGFFRGKSEEDLKNLKEEEFLSGLMFGENPDGSRTLYDFGVEVQIDET